MEKARKILGFALKLAFVALLILNVLTGPLFASLEAWAGSNNFDGWIITDDAVGTAASPAAAGFGFTRAAHGEVPTGPTIRAGANSPNGVTTGNRGSLWIENDAGNAKLWQNTDAGTTWTQL